VGNLVRGMEEEHRKESGKRCAGAKRGMAAVLSVFVGGENQEGKNAKRVR